jgi:hypothetical protein
VRDAITSIATINMARWMPRLKIPLISDEAINIDEEVVGAVGGARPATVLSRYPLMVRSVS